jgi:hypothetical protein
VSVFVESEHVESAARRRFADSGVTSVTRHWWDFHRFGVLPESLLDRVREGIDTSNATGRMVAGVLASLAELSEAAMERD